MIQPSAPLPHTEERGQGCPAEREAPPATARTYGILVVDDELAVGGLLEIGLREQGLTVWLAVNGREALDLYLRNRPMIDVVLLDVRMPGWDGPQTLAALQELNPKICCCFMSGDIGSSNEGPLRDLGAGAVLQKPFPLAQAAHVLRELASTAEVGPSNL